MRCLIVCFLVFAALTANADDQEAKPSLQDLVGKPVRITMKPSPVFIWSGPPCPPGMLAYQGDREVYTCVLISFNNEVLNVAPLPSAPKIFGTKGLVLDFETGLGAAPAERKTLTGVKVDALPYLSEMGISKKEVESVQPHQEK